MKKKIKINFTDFWGDFDKTNNYFYNLLKNEFDVEISKNPDYIFFSVFGNQHQQFKCKKIFYTGENIAPPLNYCDWSFSFDYSDDMRNYRFPIYLLDDIYYELQRDKVIDTSMASRKFCNFVVSNDKCQERNEFLSQLSKYKKVDSGGRWMNNIGYAVSDKRKFQSEYKFSIAFENNSYRYQYPGYTTEKIIDPMTVNSIPLYWGNPLINREFNTKSFVNFYDFHSKVEMIDHIIELDKDDDKYLEMLKNPWFSEFNMPEDNKVENIKSFLYKIFN
jgi:alpha(1,3/1,4) fucosyltransferase